VRPADGERPFPRKICVLRISANVSTEPVCIHDLRWHTNPYHEMVEYTAPLAKEIR
jgi:hypothetical protein